jgi:hypothetical protein
VVTVNVIPSDPKLNSKAPCSSSSLTTGVGVIDRILSKLALFSGSAATDKGSSSSLSLIAL